MIPLSLTAAARAEAADAAALRAALVRARGAVTRAAAALGVSADTIHRRIARHGLRAWLDDAYPLSARQAARRARERRDKKSTEP